LFMGKHKPAHESPSRGKKPPAPPAHENPAGVPDLLAAGDDAGLSLEELAQTYAALMQGGADPYAEQPPAEEPSATTDSDLPIQEALAAETPPPDDDCEVSPRSILEALLFVGTPDNRPQTARQMAALMRGVSPHEVETIIAELNADYDAEGACFQIVSEDEGYRLVLRDEFDPIRAKFYGKTREARLSQGAIDILAIVAYRQGITADEVDQLRGKASSGILGQLVRRDLLRIERDPQQPRKPRYRTTDRFLDLFGLESLADLPQMHEAES
jgi:segregation and condensation protein B